MKLKLWEISLAAGVLCAIIAGAWAQSAQDSLSDKILRLHVVANSDSPEDQALKLKVRDRVLAAAEPLLYGVTTAEQASEVLRESLPYIAEQAGLELENNQCGMSVRAELAVQEFPTRRYDDFSIPAGEYNSLRVTIGDGAGKNWWCVVFPPLCAADTLDAARAAGLTDGDIALISDDGGVKIKFKCVELWEKLKKLF